MNYSEEPGKRLEKLRREIEKRKKIEQIMSTAQPIVIDTDDEYYNIQEGTYKLVLYYFIFTSKYICLFYECNSWRRKYWNRD